MNLHLICESRDTLKVIQFVSPYQNLEINMEHSVILKITRRGSRSPDNVRGIWSFHIVIMQKTAKNYNARALPLYCP